MPENLPLPPGAIRVAATSQYADLPQANTELAFPQTDIVGEEASVAETDMLPTAVSLPRKPAPKLVRHPKPDMVESIMNFPDYRILRESPKREEIKDAMSNYVYHPNYFDPFGVHPRNVTDQLWQLVMGWYSEGGSDPGGIDQLLYALNSPREEEIGF